MTDANRTSETVDSPKGEQTSAPKCAHHWRSDEYPRHVTGKQHCTKCGATREVEYV
jgi:hypothetical protein